MAIFIKTLGMLLFYLANSNSPFSNIDYAIPMSIFILLFCHSVLENSMGNQL